MRVPSVDVLIALVTSAFVIAVTKFEREFSLESANDIPNILMKFLLPLCSCNKTWKDVTQGFAFHYVMCNASNYANIDTTASLFHNLVTCAFPAGNGDKTYFHVNDVYLKTAAYPGVRYSISDVISDQPALSRGILKA